MHSVAVFRLIIICIMLLFTRVHGSPSELCLSCFWPSSVGPTMYEFSVFLSGTKERDGGGMSGWNVRIAT